MKAVSLTGVLAGALGLMMAGCMSMDEMLASEDGFWRDIGETKAVSFALDATNPLEKRLEVIPKIANQQKLAKIYVSKNAAPEVRTSARKGINDTAAFEWMFLNSKDAAIRSEALDNMKLDDAGLMKLAFQLVGSDKDGARDLAARVKDNAKLSDAIVAKAKEAFELQKEIVTKNATGGYMYNPSAFNNDIDNLERLYNSFVALAPLARDMESVGKFCGDYDVRKTRGKKEQYDFFTPFEQGMKEAFVASLSDEDRMAAIGNGSVTKSGSGNPIVTLNVDDGRYAAHGGVAAPSIDAEQRTITLTKAEILSGFKDKQLAKDVELLGNVKSLIGLPGTKQLDTVKAIKNANLRKKIVFEIIDSYKAFTMLQDAHFEMLATIPANELAAQLRWAAKEMKGNIQQFRLSGPAAAAAIKDQSVIRDLLVDDPSWAHEMGLEEDFGRAYTALLKNCTDDDTLEKVFRDAKPDEHDRIVSAWELRNVFQYMSAERHAKLLDEAKVRSAEAAKSGVVVKGFYLGMPLGDYCLINADADKPATAKWDANERVTYVFFGNDMRNSFLGVGKGMEGIEKFKDLYCKGGDGKTSSVTRSIKHLKMDGNQYDRYRWEYAHFAKYVDESRNFQVEIKDESGELTLRYPVDESIIGTEDKTKEEEQDLLSIF